MILKKIGVLSLGCVLAVAYALLGLLQGISLSLQLGSLDVSTLNEFQQYLVGFGWWLVPLGLIIGLAIGFIGGIVTALIYNYIIVKITGGLKIELK